MAVAVASVVVFRPVIERIPVATLARLAVPGLRGGVVGRVPRSVVRVADDVTTEGVEAVDDVVVLATLAEAFAVFHEGDVD